MPKTLSDIIPPSRRRAMASAEEGEYTPPSRKNRGGFPWGMTAIVVVVIAGCIGVMYAFAGASVTITPVVHQVSINDQFTATVSTGDLPFEVVSIDKSATKQVAAEGTETANEPAQGTITIYNTQEKTQELIKNTRFETPDGLIFRIHDSIIVPAKGELQVTAYADATGPSYNVGPTTFTLPGLKGSKLFDQVYAKSTGSMAGGFSGTRPAVRAETRTAEYEKMKGALETDIRTAVAERIPEGYVLVPGAIFTTYAQQPDEAGTASSATLVYKGTATAYVFPKEALAKAIAGRTVEAYVGEPVTIKDGTGLTFSSETGTPPAGAESLNFTLGGSTTIVSVVDTAAIAEAIAGKSKTAAQTILKGFKEVEEAALVVRPFWEGTLPADPTQIKVTITEEQESN